MYKLTCAHKSLPFGTMLKVTNPDTGQSVVVKVNDRGPFIDGRDLDLSYAAAQKVGLVAVGVKTMNVEVLNR
jgi:rare lipoprotein A